MRLLQPLTKTSGIASFAGAYPDATIDEGVLFTDTITVAGWLLRPRVEIVKAVSTTVRYGTPGQTVFTDSSTGGAPNLPAGVTSTRTYRLYDDISGRLLDQVEVDVTVTAAPEADLQIFMGQSSNGSNLPSIAASGDRVILVGQSQLDLDANKASFAAPSGWGSGTRYASDDYIADLMVVQKTITSGDLGTPVTFGGTCFTWSYIVVKGGGPITLGAGAFDYDGAVTLPTVAKTGAHIIVAALGQTNSQAANITGYSKVLDTTPGYEASGMWLGYDKTNPGFALTGMGTTTSINAFGIVIEGTPAPFVPIPPAINTLTAVAGNNQVALSWTAPSDNGDPILGYTLQRSTAGGVWTNLVSQPSRTYANTGLTNGVQYSYRVAAYNSAGLAAWSPVVSATPTAPPVVVGKEAYAPTPPNLSTAGAIIVNPSDNLAAIADTSPTGAAFHLNNTSVPYTNVNSVPLRLGQRVICEPGARIYGNNTGGRAFRATSGADNVVIANAEIYGFGTPGSQAQNIGVIDCKIDEWNEGTTQKGANWTIWNCTIRDNANSGIVLGDNWTVAYNTILNHSPQGIGAGFGVGGLIYGNYFRGNGESGAPGSGVNNGQIKLVFWNVGPWGVTAHDTSRFRNLYQPPTHPPYQTWQHVYATPARLKIVGNTFDIRNNFRTRAVWFDLDVRDAEVAYNTFNDSINGVFYEGSNGGWNHHNTYNRSGQIGGFSSGLHPSPYFAASAACADSSNNLLFEYETFNDCIGTAMIFLGERGRNGADWVSLPNGYALVTQAGEQIRNNFNRISLGHASNVGSADHIIRYCTLNGTSVGFGFVYQPGIDRVNEAWISTHQSYGNTFGSTQANSTKFFENGQPYSLAGWRALGRDT